MRTHLTYANVMATVAVFIAMGGSSYAAVQLSKNSVRSKHIKNGQVKRGDLGRSAVDSTKVKNGSLLSADFKAGELPAGAAGAAGPAGPIGANGGTGAQGPPGPPGDGGDVFAGNFASDGSLRPGGTPGMTATYNSDLHNGYTITIPSATAKRGSAGLTGCVPLANSGGDRTSPGFHALVVTAYAAVTSPTQVRAVFADTSDATGFANEATAFSLVVHCL